MPYFILACAVVSLLLLGCSSVEEGQTQAKNMLNTAADGIVQGIETVKTVGEKVEATVLDVQERAEQVRGGIEKMGQGATEVKEAFD
jgi:TolA-binding protein